MLKAQVDPLPSSLCTPASRRQSFLAAASVGKGRLRQGSRGAGKPVFSPGLLPHGGFQ